MGRVSAIEGRTPQMDPKIEISAKNRPLLCQSATNLSGGRSCGEDYSVYFVSTPRLRYSVSFFAKSDWRYSVFFAVVNCKVETGKRQSEKEVAKCSREFAEDLRLGVLGIYTDGSASPTLVELGHVRLYVLGPGGIATPTTAELFALLSP